MKNIVVFIIAILVMASCAKRSPVEEPPDKWNGYAKYLKLGEVTHPLLAGANKQTDIGTVTYGIDDDANFYVTYNCTSGWKLAETQMYAGDKALMPLNKAGNPRIKRFPHKKIHNPKVTTYTIRIPLTSLPPAEFPGFTVAAHALVYNPLKCEGVTKHAWADGPFAFTDKDWGWFDTFYYNQPDNPFTILYGTAYTQDSLRLYHLNMTTGTNTLILTEYVGNTAGTYDGTAYNVDSSMFFFTNVNTGELFGNRMNDSLPSFSLGILSGIAASATFYNGLFYYVDPALNAIKSVSFNSDWSIASESILSTIPNSVIINDIAMNPSGTNLYMIGNVNGGGTELITWYVNTNTYYSLALAIDNGGAQIAYGSDGILYTIAPIVEGGSSSSIFTLNPDTGVLIEIEEGGVIILPSAFNDISTGPIM